MKLLEFINLCIKASKGNASFNVVERWLLDDIANHQPFVFLWTNQLPFKMIGKGNKYTAGLP
jgi:hypothetical protein